MLGLFQNCWAIITGLLLNISDKSLIICPEQKKTNMPESSFLSRKKQQKSVEMNVTESWRIDYTMNKRCRSF